MFIRYTVKSGDTLSSIAKDVLGAANRYPEILDEKLEKIVNPDRILAGQVLVLPDDFHGMAETVGYYTVKSGDGLLKIVRAYYDGGAERVQHIVDAVAGINNLPPNKMIKVGQRLEMPKYAGLKKAF